jgi:hypothetical protein
MILRDQIHKHKNLNLDQHMGEKIINARLALLALRNVEDSFSLFASALYEVEKLAIEFPLSYSLGQFDVDMADNFFDEFRLAFNLRTTTLLNASKAYTDQSQKRCKELETFIPGAKEKMSSQISKYFDESLAYRIMDALRNAAQHHALPMDGFSVGFANKYHNASDQSKSRERYATNPYFLKSKIVENTTLRAATRKEVDALPNEKLDAKSLIRRYAQSIRSLHEDFREGTEDTFNKCTDVLEKARSMLAELDADRILKSPELLDDREGSGKTQFIGESVFDSIKTKRKRWGGMRHYSNKYVSSEVTMVSDTEFFLPSNIWID